MHRTHTTLMAILPACTGLATAGEAPPRFVVETLPDVVDGAFIDEYDAIQSDGSVYASATRLNPQRAVLVRISPQGVPTVTDGLPSDPVPQHVLQVWATNDSGRVVGHCIWTDITTGNIENLSFLYTHLADGFGIMQDVGALAGLADADVADINASGRVLFYNSAQGPAAWSAGQGTTLLTPPVVLAEPTIIVMGEDGTYGGRFRDTDGYFRGFVWDGAAGVRVITSRATPAGLSGFASNVSDINAHGWAVGKTLVPWISGNSVDRAYVDRGNGVEILPAQQPNDPSAFATAVTDDDVIYGVRNGAGGSGIWRGDDLDWWALTELLPPDVAYSIVSFRQVSRHGAALAYATNPGWPFGDTVRLIPAGPGDYNADGVWDLADVQLFVSEFLAGARLADRDQNGTHDLADLQSWIGEFLSP
ncbi:MAG: hypothetical protein H6810_08235 [Phycisphaeraceae bacterium]|nr:MAG: hypothetical protein H6810_08235 [Phycisphaeraceae bacterium]